MNVGQIIRQALVEANVVKQDGTSPTLLTDDELVRWANQGNDEIEKILRNAEMDYLWRTLNSTDASFDYENETYDPSDFAFTGDVTIHEFNLPPDFLLLKHIRSTTTSEETTDFRQVDHSHDLFVGMLRDTNPPRDVIYFDVVGRRTLFVANPPSAAIDMEIAYIRRSPTLAFYNTGTISTTQDDETVTGSGTEWLIEDLDNKGRMEVMVADSGSAGLALGGSTGPFVDINLPGYPVDTFTSDTVLELRTDWRRTAVAARGYALATTPQIADEHHNYIVAFVKGKIEERLKMYSSMERTKGNMQELRANLTADIQERQTVDVETADDFDPDPWF